MASKKKKPDTSTTNGKLQDRAIKHAIYLERYKATLEAEVVGYLNEQVFPDLIEKLRARLERIRLRGIDSGFETTKRYVQMIRDLSETMADGGVEVRKRLESLLRELAKIEVRWQETVLQDSVPSEARVYVLPDEVVNLRIVQQVVKQPIQGKVMQEWWDELAADTQKRLTTQIGLGLSQGETADQIVRRVQGTRANGYRDGVLNVARQQAAAIVRTTSGHVTTQAREQSYREAGSALKGVQWVATLDTRTCPVCGPLDGKVYPVDEGPRPPAHWNCRCTTAPVTRSLAEILGKGRGGELSSSTRASMDGQVPDTVTYDDWIENQPAAVQDEVFGQSRGRMLRAGKISTKDLVTRTGKLRSLKDLEQ